MVITGTAYPPAIKTILKVGPVLTIFSAFGILLPTLMYNILAHPHGDHVEKFHFRSNKFGRIIRTRDEKLRQYYFDAINWQPNQQQSIMLKRDIVIQ